MHSTPHNDIDDGAGETGFKCLVKSQADKLLKSLIYLYDKPTPNFLSSHLTLLKPIIP